MILDETKKAEYLHRSYTAVDGLWFVMVQEHFGFDKALEIDEQVWKVLAKIQARKMKELASLPDSIQGLHDGFTEKLKIDGFQFQSEMDSDGSGFKVTVDKCPWLEILKKSKRLDIACQIGERIGKAEYQTWANEFDEKISFDVLSYRCKSDKVCILQFKMQD